MAEIGPHLLGRRPSPPDLRDYRLANFQGIGDAGATVDPVTEIALAVKELQLTTVTYKKWAATQYADVTKTHWWQAFNHLANASGGVVPPPSLDKVWDASFQLDQMNTNHCHPPDTLVRLADGSLKQIANVDLLDKVVTAEGRIGEVSHKMVHLHVGQMIKLRLRGHFGVRATSEHPILTARGYIPAGMLQIGDEVAITRQVERCVEHTIRFSDIVLDNEYPKRNRIGFVDRRGGVATIISAPPEIISLDRKFGRLLGLYAAEGHSSTGGQVKWSYGSHERDTLVPETVELIREVLGAEARVQHRPNNVSIVCLGGKHWALFFDRMLGKGAGGKTIYGFSGSDEFRMALLQGWIDGDGHCRRSDVAGVTVSKALAMGMYAIANDLGLRPRISVTKPSENEYARTRRLRWEVAWGTKGGRGSSTQDDSAVWRKVSAIESEDYVGHVYNLEVEGDHSYVADGIGSHNCIGFGYAGWGNTLPVDDGYLNPDGHAIYYEAKVIEGDPGGENGAYMRDGVKAMLARGRLSTYAFASSMTEILEHLRGKGSVVMGTDWCNDMFEPDANGYVKPTGGVAGGHCYLLYGIEGDTLVFKNSWGDNWGDSGSFRMYIPDFQVLLDAWGEAIATVELPL